MFNFEDALKLIAEQTVLCVGDLMLDDFVYGEVSRISPEAPAPVLAVTRSEVLVGGAGNVARNIAALGARCIFIGVVGNDDAGHTLTAKLGAEPLIECHLVVDPSRPTTRKVRFVSEHHSTHLLRADWEQARPVDGATEKAVLDRALAALPRAASVVLSDYAKGALTPRVRARRDRRREKARQAGHRRSQGQGLFDLPGRHADHAEPARSSPRSPGMPVDSEAEIAAAAAELNRAVGSEAVLVTRSEDGMSLVPARGEPIHVAAYPVKVRDVSGAGDTVVAVLAAMLAAAYRFRAGDARGQRGRRRGGRQARDRDGLGGGAARAHSSRRLARARGEDRLRLVGARRAARRMAPDRACASASPMAASTSCIPATSSSWRRRAPPATGSSSASRAMLGQAPERARGGRCRRCTRAPRCWRRSRRSIWWSMFDQDTPLELIGRVRPKVLAKGGDYRREQVVGHELVESDGGEVILIDLVPGFSTTRIVRKSRAPQAR